MSTADLTSYDAAAAAVRKAFPGAVAACEDLLGFTTRTILLGWHGRPIDPTVDADTLIAGELGRGTKTYRASLELALGGFGPQGAMLNRSLFEGMAVAYWISKHPDQAGHRFDEHDRHSQAVWRERFDTIGWLEATGVPAEAGPLSADERKRLDCMFGKYGQKPWHGFTNLKLLVEAIEHCWEEGAPRDDVWNFFAIPHADNNQTLHSGALALKGNIRTNTSGALDLDAGRQLHQVERSLYGAFWTYGQLLTLAARYFAFSDPDRDALATMFTDGRAKFVRLDPDIKVGRNDPCPCESGKKYKNCHALLA